MSRAPEISVVVPTHNRADRLSGLLRSLAAQKLDRERWEAIVVDDASSDGTAELLAAEAEGAGWNLQVIATETAGGPAKARNRGWRAATAPLVAFTDDDCEAAPTWLEALLAAHEAAPGSILQGRTGPIVAELGDLDAFARTKVIDRPGPYFQTCNIAYPRELLEALDGFDESFPRPAGEDADLGWRARELGANLAFCQDALVSHAVDQVGVPGYLRGARRGPTSMKMMRRHPELRAQVTYRGRFWHRNHPLLLIALVGLVLAPRFRPALLLTLPYLRTLVGRSGSAGGHLGHLPAHAAYDVLELTGAARESARERVLIL